MKTRSSLFACLSLIIHLQVSAQELDRDLRISLFAGAMNYQGDLQPSSFQFAHSKMALGLSIRKPVNRWITLRAGITSGSIEAADKWNRDDLKSRNLSFASRIHEAYAGIELNVLDMSSGRFTPYVFGGIAVFHFNPYAFDKYGTKTYLRPLSTEGQGMPQFPGQRSYRLTDICIPFGGGFKFRVTDDCWVGLEFNQRKSFTDYIDDVSTHFVDAGILQQQKGNKAVEMAYRGGELPGGRPFFPAHGDQRGTPSEMDWYYFVGGTVEMKWSTLAGLFRNNRSVASQRCPRMRF